jgi:hypothetical protein
MEHQRIDLLYPVLAQGGIGPGDMGMIPHLGRRVVLAANKRLSEKVTLWLQDAST